MLKWLLASASVLTVVSVVVFIVADPERQTTLRSVAAGALVVACLLTLSAALIALYERKNRSPR